MDELSELRPQFEASEARVAALQDELKRSHSQAAAAAASADQRIQVLSPSVFSCSGSPGFFPSSWFIIAFFALAVLGGVGVLCLVPPPACPAVLGPLISSLHLDSSSPCLL